MCAEKLIDDARDAAQRAVRSDRAGGRSARSQGQAEAAACARAYAPHRQACAGQSDHPRQCADAVGAARPARGDEAGLGLRLAQPCARHHLDARCGRKPGAPRKAEGDAWRASTRSGARGSTRATRSIQRRSRRATRSEEPASGGRRGQPRRRDRALFRDFRHACPISARRYARDAASGRYEPAREVRRIASTGKIIAAIGIANELKDGADALYHDSEAPAGALIETVRRGAASQGPARARRVRLLAQPAGRMAAGADRPGAGARDDRRLGFTMPPAPASGIGDAAFDGCRARPRSRDRRSACITCRAWFWRR